MKRLILGLAALGLFLSAACSSDQPRETAPAQKGAVEAPSTTTTATTAPAKPARVGETIRGEKAGNYTVVHALASIAGDEWTRPDAGNRWLAADVEQCIGAGWLTEYRTASGSEFAANPFQWELQMPDNTRRQAEIAVKEPALHSTEFPATGGCVRGWVTFEVPQGQNPAYVVFVVSESGKYRWAV